MKKLTLKSQGEMSIIDFKYWLQGAFELGNLGTYQDISAKQVKIIREHLNLVKKKDEFLTTLDGILISTESSKDRIITVSLASQIKGILEQEFIKLSNKSDIPKRVSDTVVCSAANPRPSLDDQLIFVREEWKKSENKHGLKKDPKIVKYC